MLKFAGTGEAMLLEYAMLELQKVISADDDENERLHIDKLVCSREIHGTDTKLSLLEAIFISVSIWCDSKLQDYHLHFSQVSCN